MRSLFQFKQFSVSDAQCGMKLTGDAVLLGSIAKPPLSGYVLDIGCGCGILSLMMAQQSKDAEIQAIDIDEAAVIETQKNFERSLWKTRLSVVQISVQQYAAENKATFNHIICNPPYFRNSLKSQNPEKRIARHTVTLSTEELFEAVENLLADNACFWVIFPADELKQNLQLALRFNLFAKRCTLVKHREHDRVVRVVLCFTKEAITDCVMETLIIKDANNQNSAMYQELTHDFYL
jgi:tRNA1Val (adenine37-N6)-methyltransferase